MRCSTGASRMRSLARICRKFSLILLSSMLDGELQEPLGSERQLEQTKRALSFSDGWSKVG